MNHIIESIFHLTQTFQIVLGISDSPIDFVFAEYIGAFVQSFQSTISWVLALFVKLIKLQKYENNELQLRWSIIGISF